MSHRKKVEVDMVDVSGLCNVADFTESIDDTNNNWTQISIPERLIVPSQKPDIDRLLSVNVGVNIVRTHLIVTPKSDGVNWEGKKLTGRKLVIEGELCQTVQYAACDSSVHSAHFAVPFSAYIVVPDDRTEVYDVASCVEDVYIENFSERDIFKNVTLFLQAIPTTKSAC